MENAYTEGTWDRQRDTMAFWLRLGLGSVFVIGGWSKLSQLLSADKAGAMVEQYVGPAGYINTFFMDYLFGGLLGNVASPWGFLTALSSFELISGLMLIAGLCIRPIALLYAFLLWSFVFSLPVVTTPGVDPGVTTYTAPAIFVQIRDICLSGMMFVLFNLGADKRSLDKRIGGVLTYRPSTHPQSMGLLLRLSLAAPLLIGGFFSGMPNIQSFGLPAFMLIIAGLALVSGVGLRVLAGLAVAGILWFIFNKLSMEKSLIGNLNGIKRELALVSGYALLAWFGGGQWFTAARLWKKQSGGGKIGSENRAPA